MSVVNWLAWGEVALLAATLGFGLATRLAPPDKADLRRNVHLALAVLTLFGMIVVAITIGSVTR